MIIATNENFLYDENVDYTFINNLGDVNHNQVMKDARGALALPAEIIGDKLA